MATVDPVVLVLLFEAAFLALAAVTGMAFFNVTRDPHDKRAMVLVALAGGLTYYATRRLPHDPILWLGLVPLGALFAVLGFFAGKGFLHGRKPSMEEQIEQLTGEHVEWSDLKPNRKPRWRR